MNLRAFFRYRLLPIAASLLFLAGCSTLRAQPPEIALAGVQVRRLTLSHAILSADLDLYNPNDFGIHVREISYTLELDHIRVARGNSLESLRLGAHQSGLLPVRLSTSYLNLLRLGPVLEQGRPLPYELTGEVVLGTSLVGSRGIPFSHKGTLDLSEFAGRPPATDIGP